MGTIGPIVGTTVNSSILSNTLFGRTRSAILGVLYGHTDESFYFRQLVRITGAGKGAVQREVKQLADAGLIVRNAVGNQTFYRANRESPVFPEIKSLVTKTVGVHDVLRRALEPLRKDIRAAFVYGSVAQQKETAQSDVDLMIVGDVDFSRVVSKLSEAQKKLNREINPTLYPVSEFRSKVASGNHFLNSVLKDPKLFIFGDENELRELGNVRMARKARKQSARD